MTMRTGPDAGTTRICENQSGEETTRTMRAGPGTGTMRI